MRYVKILSVIMFVLLISISRWYDITFADVVISGMEITATYTEPTENVLNNKNIVLPLQDLKQTYATYEMLDTDDGEILCGSIMPALQASGGNEIEVKCVLPLQQNTENHVDFRARAEDLSGNISEPIVLQKTFDKLSPQLPTW